VRRPGLRLRATTALLATAAALLSAFGVASAQAIDHAAPVNLRVAGGETAWHALNLFRLDWDPPAAAAELSSSASAKYLVRDGAGQVVVPATRFSSPLSGGGAVHVPPQPGRYTAEIWFEDGNGSGPHVSASLLFDDVRPGSARVLGPVAWVGGGRPAALRIEQPPGPLPVSGIRGYAIAVDRQALGSACAAPGRCSEAETNVSAATAAEPVSLGALPEGISFAHVVAVSGAGLSSAVETVELRIDATRPDVTLAGVPQGWADGPVRLQAAASDPLSGMAASGPGGPFTAIAIDGGLPTVSPGPEVAATVSGDGIHQVSFYGRDAAGNNGDGRTGAAPPFSTVVRIDTSSPALAFVATRDPSDPERIEALVGDPLSGPSPDRGSISLRPVGTRAPFQPLATSVSPGRLVAHWDSDAYPTGTYEFRASGFDLAGNAGSGDRRTDGARMVLANPLKTPTEISFGLQPRRRGEQGPARRAAGGGAIAVRGRLASVTGSPLGGVAVEVVETFDAGAETRQRLTRVFTAADGGFQLRLAPGPSRLVEARFAGNRLLTRAGSEPLRLAVPAAVRFHASAATATIGGAPVLFSGRVGSRGARIPRSGLPVELQFRVPGSPWSEFRTVQTDPHGRFRYAYAFSDDDSRGIRFQFRAAAVPQENWPYERAASRAVAVTGR
jgi:hypothetical protein